MAQTEQIVVDIKFDTKLVDDARTKLAASITAVNDLKKAQTELNKTIKEQGYATKEQAAELAQINKDLEEATRARKSNTAVLQAATQAQYDNSQSLDDQRQFLNTLQKAFASLTKEQMEMLGGQEHLQEQIKSVSDSLKEQEHAIGEDGRNVGNYAESITKAFGDINQAAGALSPAIGILRGMGPEGQKAAAALDMLGKTMQIAGKAGQILAASHKAQAAATQTQTVAQNGLNVAMEANPVGLIIAGITTLLPLIQAFCSAIGDASKEQAEFNRQLEGQNKLLEQNMADAEFEAQLMALRGKNTKEQVEVRRRAAEENLKIADKEVDDLYKVIQEGSRREKKAAREALKDAQEQQKKAWEILNGLNKESIKAELTTAKERKEIRKSQLATRLEIERALEDSVLALEKDATKKAALQAQRSGEREIENLRVKLNSLKEVDKKGRDALQQLIVAKEKETQQKVNEILIKGQNDREAALRENLRAQMEFGVRDNLILSQIRYDNAQEDYDRLINLSEEYKTALYSSDEQYAAAVLAAQKTLYDAQETLATEKYEREKLEESNRWEEKKNAVINDSVAIAQVEYEQAVAENEQLINLDEETKNRLYSSQQEYEAAIIASNQRVKEANKKAIEAQRQMVTANAQAVSSMLGSLTGLLDQFGEENRDAALASKAIALGKIAVDTGIAIAGGVAQAQSVPFPANIAAIATTIATVIANMASAISTVKGAKFASGGIVGGTSYTGDQVNARLNSGEMVLNKDQQTRLFDAVSGGTNGSLGFNYELMAQAMSAQPAPVMAYEEFKSFEQDVTTYNELAGV